MQIPASSRVQPNEMHCMQNIIVLILINARWWSERIDCPRQHDRDKRADRLALAHDKRQHICLVHALQHQDDPVEYATKLIVDLNSCTVLFTATSALHSTLWCRSSGQTDTIRRGTTGAATRLTSLSDIALGKAKENKARRLIGRIKERRRRSRHEHGQRETHQTVQRGDAVPAGALGQAKGRVDCAQATAP